MNLTRERKNAQKRSVCFFAEQLLEGLENGQIAAADADHLLANLPPDAVITDAYVHVKTPSDAATSLVITLGTTEGGSEILSAADGTVAGKTGTFTGQSLTDSGEPLWVGLTYVGAATNVGEYVVVVEYLEYTKTTGEYTKL